MAASARELRQQVLALAEDERAELAAELLASLEEPAEVGDGVVEAEWASEIERRARAVIAGESRGVPWERVREEISDELAG